MLQWSFLLCLNGQNQSFPSTDPRGHGALFIFEIAGAPLPPFLPSRELWRESYRLLLNLRGRDMNIEDRPDKQSKRFAKPERRMKRDRKCRQ